jgi:dihydroorotate dehydrogenase (fumarate)
MANLTTNYMGLTLRNPIIVSSSGLTDSVDKINELEKHGAGAVVLKSLFEEQIMMDIDANQMNNIFGTYSDAENYIGYYARKNALSSYIDLIDGAKDKSGIPVIASINCYSADQWMEFAGDVEAAGADALELNMFIMPSDTSVTGAEIEKIYLNVVKKVVTNVTIPVGLKIHHYFSGMSNFLVELSKTGIKSLVLFNRFYQPDIDLEKEKIITGHVYSSPADNALVLRWLSILSGKVECDLAASTGIHSGESVLKNIFAGASAVQIASVVYQKGPLVISTMINEMNLWLDNHGYASSAEITGKLRQSDSIRPMAYERAQFMRYFSDAGR